MSRPSPIHAVPPVENGEPVKPKKPVRTGAKLFSLVWQRCARELSRLPSDMQRAVALGCVVEELRLPLELKPGSVKLPPGQLDPRD